MNRGYIRCKGTAATALLTAFGLVGMNVRRLHKWHTTRGLTDPWCLALGEDPDPRPLDHYYRTVQPKRRQVRRD